MKRVLGLIVLGAVGLVLAAAVGLGVFLATFNPNDYKERISSAVEKATGKPLRFDGDIEMTLFPSLGLKAANVSMPDKAGYGTEPFLSVETVSLSVALEPLFDRILAVNEITLHGARLKLARNTPGVGNWEKETPREQGTAPSSGQPEGATDRDEQAQSGDSAESVADTVSAVASSPVSGANAAEMPTAPTTTSPRFVFKADKIACTDLSVVYQDMGTGAAYTAALDDVEIIGAGLDADIPLSLSGVVTDERSGRHANVFIQGLARASSSGEITARIDAIKMTAHGFTDTPLLVEGEGYLAVDRETRSVTVEQLHCALQLAEGEPEGDMPGAPAVGTAFQGRLAYAPPLHGRRAKLNADLRFAELDVDALTSRLRSGAVSAGTGSVRGAPNMPHPKVVRLGSPQGSPEEFSHVPGSGSDTAVAARIGGVAAPPDVEADVSLIVERLLLQKLSFTGVAVTASLHDGSLRLPFSGELFKGTVSGDLKAALSGSIPSVSLSCAAKNVDLEAAAIALATQYAVVGRLEASVEVTGQGEALQTVLHNLKGKASFKADGGEIRGFRLIPADLPALKAIPVNFPFKRIAASAVIKDGIATSRDISLQSPVLTGRGGGVVRLAFGQMDVGIDFMPGGIPPAVPVSISGPFASLSTSVDMRTFMRNVAESAAKTPESATRGLLRGAGELLLRQ